MARRRRRHAQGGRAQRGRLAVVGGGAVGRGCLRHQRPAVHRDVPHRDADLARLGGPPRPRLLVLLRQRQDPALDPRVVGLHVALARRARQLRAARRSPSRAPRSSAGGTAPSACSSSSWASCSPSAPTRSRTRRRSARSSAPSGRTRRSGSRCARRTASSPSSSSGSACCSARAVSALRDVATPRVDGRRTGRRRARVREHGAAVRGQHRGDEPHVPRDAAALRDERRGVPQRAGHQARARAAGRRLRLLPLGRHDGRGLAGAARRARTSSARPCSRASRRARTSSARSTSRSKTACSTRRRSCRWRGSWASSNVLLQSDVQYERFDTPRPQALWLQLRRPPPGMTLREGLRSAHARSERSSARSSTRPSCRSRPNASYPPALAVFPVARPARAAAHRVDAGPDRARRRRRGRAAGRGRGSARRPARGRSSTRPPRRRVGSRPSRRPPAPSSCSPTRTRTSSTPGARCTRRTATSRQPGSSPSPTTRPSRRSRSSPTTPPRPRRSSSCMGIRSVNASGYGQPRRQRARGPAAQRRRRRPEDRVDRRRVQRPARAVPPHRLPATDVRLAASPSSSPSSACAPGGSPRSGSRSRAGRR